MFNHVNWDQKLFKYSDVDKATKMKNILKSVTTHCTIKLEKQPNR